MGTGHDWEATFENWESEFLQMAAFILLTTFLIQKGSPESRRPGVMFFGSWAGHAAGGYAEYRDDRVAPGLPEPVMTDYVTSSRFWFESFQNWQSEFLAIAAMVWLAVYLRQRYSAESKPVHAPHSEGGR